MATDSEERRFRIAYRALHTIAVTGTNGKTSTTSMVDAIVAASGEASARLTTLGAFVRGEAVPLPSPAQEFLVTVEAAIAAGVKSFALEVTSKALRKGWAQEWPAHVAVFTNLSRDHMDMHGSPEAYLACKAQLFMHVAAGGTCVLNADDPSAHLIAEVIPDHARVVYYSAGAGRPDLPSVDLDLAASSVQCSPTGLRIELAASPFAELLGGRLELAVMGNVHAGNALAAALACARAGYSPEAIQQGLASFRGVPGRFEVIAREPLCVVDYAHTPEGLRGTLQTARALVGPSGRLHLVFGCGGQRDQGKRAPMGEVAHALADQVILTNDNPRREDPQAIAAQVQAGARGPGAHWEVCLDREQAVARAVARAGAADVVIIAGKGHEAVQEIAGISIPMCDAELVRWARGANGSDVHAFNDDVQ